MNQVTRDKWLLDIAQDCFYFMTDFFEVINASATHIYHSALELSPLSSIVRRLYYHQRLTSLPSVVAGIPDSWDQSIGIPNQDYEQVNYAWSPCGQFIATQDQGSIVGIRDPLTFGLLSILQPAGYSPYQWYPLCGLAYSPDGCSLACLNNTAVIVWDIQTGGVVKEIEHNGVNTSNTSLVWSLDGRKIGTILRTAYAWTVQTFDIISGTTSSPGTLWATNKPHLWADNTSFQIMEVEVSVPTNIIDKGEYLSTRALDMHDTINIFEVGTILTKIKSFNIKLQHAHISSFSPTTSCVSISTPDLLLLLDIQNSEHLLEETGNFHKGAHSFSPDGSLFAAYSQGYSVHVWRYTPNHYIPWRVFPSLGNFHPSTTTLPLQFSPTLSSIMGHCAGLLRVWHLDSPPVSLATCHHQLAICSYHDSCIVTAHKGGSIVTITNLLSKTTSQLIETGTEILTLTLIGNSLLVKGTGETIAWPLTEGGVVDGVFGNRMANRGDSIWAVQQGHLLGQGFGGNWKALHHRPQDGWLKSLEGKHKLWIPTRWRACSYHLDHPHNVITLHLGSQSTAVIMF